MHYSCQKVSYQCNFLQFSSSSSFFTLLSFTCFFFSFLFYRIHPLPTCPNSPCSPPRVSPQWQDVHEQPKRGGVHRRHLLPDTRRRHQRGECCPLLVMNETTWVHRFWPDLSWQYGSVGPMAITLSQSLGQNIGMLRNKEQSGAGEDAGRRKCLII